MNLISRLLLPLLVVAQAFGQDPTTETPPELVIIESEVMPAQITPRSPQDLNPEAALTRPPRNPPWAGADEVGARAPFAKWYTNTYGWNIPAEVPRDYSAASHAASNNSVINTHYSGPGGPVNWSDVVVYGVPPEVGKPVTTRWGIIAFNFWQAKFVQCTFHTIPGEHGLYLTGWAPINFEKCEWYDVGGQAVQHVYSYPGTKREKQTNLSENIWLRLFSALQDDWITVRRCRVRDVGNPTISERASFAMSFFEPTYEGGVLGNPVHITESWFRTSVPWVDANGQNRDCTGIAMVHNRSEFVFERNFGLYRLGDRDVIQSWGVPKVRISENYIIAKQPIDIRVNPGSSYDIIISRNQGDAEVVVSTNAWYAWENTSPPYPVWDEEKVLYRGHITKNARIKSTIP